ncbi:MAG: PAS domain S-box protein [Myxococcota bacterium]
MESSLPQLPASAFEQLFAALPGRYVAVLPDAPRFTVAAVSDTYVATTGLTREALLGAGLPEVFQADEEDPFAACADDLRASLGRVLATRAPDAMPRSYDFRRGARPSGPRSWRAVHFPVLGAEGQLVFLLHRLEEQVTLSGHRPAEGTTPPELAATLELARLGRILSLAPSAILVVDGAQRIILYNEGAERMFGWTSAEALGRPHDDLIPARYRDSHRVDVQRYAASDEPPRLMGSDRPRVLALRKSGEEFWAEASISRVDFGDERLLAVALRDVTERVSAEEAARRRARESQFLAEVGSTLASSRLDLDDTLRKLVSLPLGVLGDVCAVDLVDDDGDLRRVAMTATDPTLAGACAARIGDAIGAGALARAVFERGEPIVAHDPEPGALPGAHFGAPLRARGLIVGCLSLCRTERYGADDEHLVAEFASRAAMAIDNAQLYDKAQRAIAARDRMLGSVAHDLRNPLTGILGVTAILERGGADPRAVEGITRSAKRMRRLIEDMLDVARIESASLGLHRGPLALEAVIAEAVEGARRTSTAVGVDVAPTAGLPLVWADRDRVLQVLDNLVGNAVKFTPPQGRVEVGASAGDGEVS